MELDKMKKLVFVLAAFGFLLGCSEGPSSKNDSPTPEISTPKKNVLSLEIEGWSFAGPNEIASGWTTIRVKNDSGMTHFGLVYKLPDGVTAQMVSDQVVKPFQEGLTARLEGDVDKANEIAKTVPAWIGEFVYLGGLGMISDGVTGEATMYLEPAAQDS